KGSGRDFQPLFTGFTNKNSVIDHRGGYFYVHTDVEAPNYRLVRIPVDNVEQEHWENLIPGKEFLLESVSSVGDILFATYLENATHQVYAFNHEGEEQG